MAIWCYMYIQPNIQIDNVNLFWPRASCHGYSECFVCPSTFMSCGTTASWILHPRSVSMVKFQHISHPSFGKPTHSFLIRSNFFGNCHCTCSGLKSKQSNLMFGTFKWILRESSIWCLHLYLTTQKIHHLARWCTGFLLGESAMLGNAGTKIHLALSWQVLHMRQHQHMIIWEQAQHNQVSIQLTHHFPSVE